MRGEGAGGRLLIASAATRAGTLALIAGGVLMAALFVPFTLSHGPTSYNEERVLLGHDMLGWGLALGVVPGVLIGAGLWPLRRLVSGPRRTAHVSITGVCLVLWAAAVADLAFGGLGPPFGTLVLGPAALTVAVRAAPQVPAAASIRAAFAVLGLVLVAASGFALVPTEASDAFGGFRIFGILAYGVAGFCWAGLGVVLQGSAVRVVNGPAPAA